MLTRARRRWGVLLHRILRALRELIKAFRTAGQHRTGDRSLTARRANRMPYCPTCRRRVARLCEEDCGRCPSCCPGHDDEEPT